MTIASSVLIVGSSASGLATAESLRRRGFAGGLTLLGDEAHPPYDRPPLSKQVLTGEWTPDRTVLRDGMHLAGLQADIVLGDAAIAFDASTRTVTTESGRHLSAEAIVIATGARPRRFPGQDDLTGVHVLRTLDDALELREALLGGPRVVVVGEGVLGSEIAASARALGADVTIVGPLASPLLAQVGPLVSAELAALHERNGVRLRLGAGVSGLVGADRHVTGVRLATGEVINADVVVVAIGATPATEWLEGSGLTIDRGVACDPTCRAAEGVYAVGDVARWHHRDLATDLRLENRTNATEQADAVAQSILGSPQVYVPVPYFWTDQFDVKVQVFGSVAREAEAEIVEGAIDDGRFVARFSVDGVISAVVGWNMPKQARLRSRSIGTVREELPVSPTRPVERVS